MSNETIVTEERLRTVEAADAVQPPLPARPAWNADQVGVRLACSARHVFRMADGGLMPWGFKLGSLRRWNADEIEAWIAGGAKPVRKGGR